MAFANPNMFYRDGDEREWVLDRDEINNIEGRGGKWLESYLKKYPIKVNNADGTLLVVTGEEAAYAAVKLGLEEVPYIVLDDVEGVEKKVKVRDMILVSKREYALTRKPHSVRDRFVE